MSSYILGAIYERREKAVSQDQFFPSVCLILCPLLSFYTLVVTSIEDEIVCCIFKRFVTVSVCKTFSNKR
jgi:hypothetical protein